MFALASLFKDGVTGCSTVFSRKLLAECKEELESLTVSLAVLKDAVATDGMSAGRIYAGMNVG